VDDSQLRKYIDNARALSRQTPPTKNIPTLSAIKNFFPNTEEGWSYQKEGMVGRAAAIHLHNGQTGGKRQTKHIYEIIIEAEHTQENKPTQYWGRLSTDPNTSVLFTSDEWAANAVQAHEILARAKRKPVFHRRYSVTTNPTLSTELTEGDFTTGNCVSDTWLSSLQQLRELTGSNDYRTLDAGIKISTRKLYGSTEARVRRCFATVLEHRNKHTTIPILLDLFWGMMLAPKKRATSHSFNHAVNERCRLFEEGKWSDLYKNITYKKPRTQQATTRQQNEEDKLYRKAKQAQDRITKDKSVSAAMKTLRSPRAF
jgi:hypothetical protein